MHWQHRNKRGDRKALKPTISTSILSQTKHPKQAKKLRNPKSRHWGVHFHFNQTTTNAVQRRIANIAKRKLSNGKLTRVRNECSLAGNKSIGNKSKVGNKEGEEQWPMASTVAAKVQRRQENSKAEESQKVTQKEWSPAIHRDPKT